MSSEANNLIPNKGSLRKQRIGDWLVELNLITKRQLDEAISQQSESGERIGSILIRLGYLSEKELSDVLMLQETLTSRSSLTEFPIDVNVLRLLSETFVKQNLVIPLLLVGNRLVVALNQADNISLIDRISLLTGYRIIPLSFRQEDLQLAVVYFYESKMLQNVGTIERAIQAGGAGEEQKEGNEQPVRADDGPIVELVNSVLADAIESNASDIHLDAQERCIAVRMRIDGVLSQVMEIPKSLASSVIARIKVMAEMNITERRRPQDGRFTMRYGASKIDFRVSSISSHWGETIVIRLLRPLNMSRGLEKLGFDEKNLTLFKQIISATTGIVLVTGPTGSGKTSTLYTSLGQLDKVSDKIATIEDPVEFPLEGIVQIQIVPKIGLTFASALRTLLRQDPDVVMLGEIRDGETLEAAIAAALTGHLVLSTIHSNDAISTISRMQDMGALPFLISSTLVGVIAQRLVRRICEECGEDYPATAEEKEFLKVDPAEKLFLRRGKGCKTCKGSGYKGQVAVFEILRVNRSLRDMINRSQPTAVLWEAAREMGFRTLLEDGKLKVMNKMTTVQEVIRVLGDGTIED